MKQTCMRSGTDPAWRVGGLGENFSDHQPCLPHNHLGRAGAGVRGGWGSDCLPPRRRDWPGTGAEQVRLPGPRPHIAPRCHMNCRNSIMTTFQMMGWMTRRTRVRPMPFSASFDRSVIRLQEGHAAREERGKGKERCGCAGNLPCTAQDSIQPPLCQPPPTHTRTPGHELDVQGSHGRRQGHENQPAQPHELGAVGGLHIHHVRCDEHRHAGARACRRVHRMG